MHAPDDPYAPPRADVRASVATGDAFYVVSPLKLVVLYVATFGLYQMYWFYRHWDRWQTVHGVRVRPVVRALFALFTVHALARRIDEALRAVGSARRWWPMAVASVFFLCEAVSWGTAFAGPEVAARWPATTPWMDWSGIALMPLACASLVRLQLAANAACGDPQALRNRRFTLYNRLWIVGGVSVVTIATVIVFHMRAG
ncbi:hypothetical protein MNO14_00695 [Luteimonas sp. S4-F44]|uniref:hypothetical protein n=1 Tax=Luteimonas sp. S4-F44 TaxID=2925842 RepID=UPI001F52EB75|nr:hypothetical protein [Luteimonas sp. S4-F44]UNK42658.1 hypothetical protein MNO14_00695 [Luteimonas sp. S4-F44]